jgi:adenine specific DNA methylase Mod
VSIDDNAAGLLGPLLDEIFGGANFVTTVIWEKANSPRKSARQFSTGHDYSCHRRLHYGKDAHEYRERLFQFVPELTWE